ncbi:hypothetical protein CG723_41030 [Streptomyces sp. CB01635]|uniref:hypothetical protein n=1 Tax=unclassified Streptomyces TaxID=2593676 RepID=UPI000CA7DB8A|nr:hypothetical protein [Streptomyces sp. CB01635]PJN06128.1 hypothetical protein CG723_41030 [Streptomyces sp. CB01635]
MPEIVWTATSAIATTAALWVIAWQAILTRRGVDIQSAVALDSARARLDSQAPDVVVQLEDPSWPPLAWSHMGLPVNPWPNGQIWYFPEKEHERIVLQTEVIVRHFYSGRLEVTFAGDLVDDHDGRARRAQPVLLAGDGEHSVLLHKDFTIKQLSENYHAQQEGRCLPHRVQGTVTVHDGRDNGVTDTWSLDLTGCPIQPHESRDGAWVVVPDHLTDGTGLRSLVYIRRPARRRTYWISRQDGLELPAPRYT